MKCIAILQSDYIPWKGYFDIINYADEFIVYDDAQYTKRDWRNRNIIKTVNGTRWITVPVEVKNKNKQSIKETMISGNVWINKHLKILRYNYSKAKYFEETFDYLSKIYICCERCVFLSEINLFFIKGITEYLGISTKIRESSEFQIEGNKSEKILNICLQAGASEYLTGEAARFYLDVEAFKRSGITVKWMDYSGYKEYIQLYPPFLHRVSIVDLMFNMGPGSSEYLKSHTK
jgi:hypothetical protein